MTRQKLLPVFSTLLLLTSLSTQAALTPQQEIYLDTLKAAQNGKDEEVSSGLKQLGDYPLRPYILYSQLRSRLDKLSAEDALDFSARYPDIPIEGRLRWALTTSLGERGDWSGFRELYSTLNNPSTEQQCYAGRADLAEGKRKSAYSLAARLWVEGHSQPNACDPLFDSWMKAGGLQDQHALTRVLEALESGNTSLAKYAGRKAQGAATQQQIAFAQALFENPRQLLESPAILTTGNPEHRRLLMLAVNRLRRSDLDAAIDLWVRDRERLNVPAEEQFDLTNRLGIYKAKRFSPDADSALARLDPDFRVEELTEWRARLAMTRLDWPEVERLISKLPQEQRLHERWQYWLSVAQRQQGKPVDALLKQLSQDRTFYGFLAAEVSDAPFSLNHEAADLDQATLHRLAALPAFQRIRELYAVGRLYDARSEWNAATRNLPLSEQHLAAHLVNRWGWHTQGIRGAIQSEQWNDLDIRFPDPYRTLFDTAAERNGITKTWATAIARQESAFWVQARSHAGARGLMQLMPATARQTAKKHSLPLNGIGSLYDPETNINLGSAYLGEMYRRFNSNRVFATAAYNAGPHRVNRWLEARGDLPLDIWIETIPFDETRNYVQNVLSFAVIYDRRAGRKASLLSDTEKKLLAFNQLP
ncbi:transglycosylase SLT domain-containing protein [Marinobacterium sp. YM272]|uniref:transglycosylase SLT domain-containing protein n=1 Tax=Marinobacterium sp. YM272 TaxID=3421654 RepID=UPI003D7F2D67